LFATAVAIPLVLSGCSAVHAAGGPKGGATGSTGSTNSTTPQAGATTSLPPPPPSGPRISISPASGSVNAATAGGIIVTVPSGRLESVTVHAAGDPVTGEFGVGHRSWHSLWTLDVATHYTVTATAIDKAGHVSSETSSFGTLNPQQTFQTQIWEGYLLTYGVGMPIELDFSSPITNKAAVERALQITSSKPVVGAWYWNGDQQVDFRPRTYWPADTRVSFVGHLNGVEGAPGLYGVHTLTQTFNIGQSVIVVAGAASHHMQLYIGGKLRYTWPISTGRPGLDTPNGTYLTVDKANPQLMVGPGYRLEVPWSVRFTMSGDFLHDAYWSVGVQGFTNVSHGCVNMPPADAQLYYQMAVPGDPVTITGSPLAGTWGDGFTEWFLGWNAILAGSAVPYAVVAGPHGSRFVRPSALPPSHGTAPLETSPYNNSLAA
jgi:lipoprotein-anchoring transpeptidase ErfK/SrfK